MIKVAPSVLSADYLNLKEQLSALEEGRADWLHFDVMDGHFVPNLTFGPKILNDMCKATSLFKDVHIMVDNPVTVAPWFENADLITFHYESNDSVPEVIETIKQAGKKVGISVKPKTDVTLLTPYLREMDLVLVMSVEPGFGGQAFMSDMLDKVKWLREYRETNGLNYLIEIDGGINAETSPLAIEAGCDVLVAGSYVFKGDIKEKIRTLKLASIRVVYEAEKCRTAAYDQGKLIGECDYMVEGNMWNFCHTEVKEEYKGMGIAAKLVELLLNKCEEEGHEVKATCSYVKRYIEAGK